MTEQSSSDDIAVVILAAGRSVRMGQPKQLMLWHGKSLIERACSTALETHCGPVVAVLG
ncbi:NTP transferase domain-containing protein, partial [Staphylococcus aureus]